jgi:hypothetical protein
VLSTDIGRVSPQSSQNWIAIASIAKNYWFMGRINLRAGVVRLKGIKVSGGVEKNCCGRAAQR